MGREINARAYGNETVVINHQTGNVGRFAGAVDAQVRSANLPANHRRASDNTR